MIPDKTTKNKQNTGMQKKMTRTNRGFFKVQHIESYLDNAVFCHLIWSYLTEIFIIMNPADKPTPNLLKTV